MVDQTLADQVDFLIKILLRNPNIKAILNGNPFPFSKQWYLGAGCLCQTIWNHLVGNKITRHIEDYDLVYFDGQDLSKIAQTKTASRLKKQFADLKVKLDIVNEARVHFWFEKDYGRKINPYQSVEDAIRQWPTTATCVAINKIDKTFNVFAPYGLNDLFGMVIRPICPYTIRKVYEKKVKKWTFKWPELKVMPWRDV